MIYLEFTCCKVITLTGHSRPRTRPFPPSTSTANNRAKHSCFGDSCPGDHLLVEIAAPPRQTGAGPNPLLPLRQTGCGEQAVSVPPTDTFTVVWYTTLVNTPYMFHPEHRCTLSWWRLLKLEDDWAPRVRIGRIHRLGQCTAREWEARSIR